MIAVLEGFFAQLLSTADITGGVNLGVISTMFLLAMLSEVYIQVPFLIESVWLLVGYQSTMNGTAILNVAIIYLVASAGRQIVMLVMFREIGAINTSLSRLYASRIQKSKHYRRYAENKGLYEMKFLSVPSAALGMLTWLNGPIKFVLILKRRLRVLLLGTLFSGMTFDAIYLTLGAVFGKTPLQLAYLPILLLVGFLFFVVMKVKVAR